MIELMINEMIILLVAGLSLDLILRDPRRIYHPVQAIGHSSVWLEKNLRRFLEKNLKAAGVIFLITELLFWTASSLFVLHLSLRISPWLYWIISLYLTYSLLAAGALIREVGAVRRLLKEGDLPAARTRAQEIVSRDLSQAEEPEIVRAMIETGTENISDGIVAPIFYFALGGPVLMLFYKVVNTLDSMVGYRNERYRDFGWASARLDDGLNYLPARLTGLLIVLVALGLGDDYRQAWRAWHRDGQKGPSPNGGIPITAFAGARDLRLGGPCHAREGKESDIPFVGGKRTQFGHQEITRVIIYIYGVSFLAGSIALISVSLFD
ncbi:MAG: adenosylcobinamide-phosphate synthase CbiB [Candidatus Paceibacterota bacterium]